MNVQSSRGTQGPHLERLNEHLRKLQDDLSSCTSSRHPSVAGEAPQVGAVHPGSTPVLCHASHNQHFNKCTRKLPFLLCSPTNHPHGPQASTMAHAAHHLSEKSLCECAQERRGAETPRIATPRGRSFAKVLCEQQQLQRELAAERGARDAAEARALVSADEAAAAVDAFLCPVHARTLCCILLASLTCVETQAIAGIKGGANCISFIEVGNSDCCVDFHAGHRHGAAERGQR